MTGPKVQSKGASIVIERQAQVSWFDTRQLTATAVQSVTAQIIGSMTGRRELIAALEPEGSRHYDFSHKDTLDLDYVADTGDGWNATTSVAWLVGRDGLVVGEPGKPVAQPVPADCFTEGMPEAGAGQTVLPAGEVLVLGGDQVYPVASPDSYKTRFTDPWRCARWHAEPPRTLFPIPGNHDWYDGLTSFVRLFCRSEHSRRWFGCWQAQQRRSYYALKLPHGWWLWGLDTALEDDLDPQQHDYFYEKAQELEDGDKLILVVPAPVWLDRDAEDDFPTERRFAEAEKLELIMTLPQRVDKDVEIPLILTGDLHYYARHQTAIGDAKRHYIVCGGGGAFGLGTLATPKTISLPDENGGQQIATLENSFPNQEESRKLRRGVLRFPRQNYRFTALLAGLQLITLWLLAGIGLNMEAIANLFEEGLPELGHSPALYIWILLLLSGFAAFAASSKNRRTSSAVAHLWGVGHGILQILGIFVATWAGFWLVQLPQFAALSDFYHDIIRLVVIVPILFVYCGFLFAFYLYLSHILLRMHDQEVFSAQAIEDYRAFLRMRIDESGLTLWPIGIRNHARKWRGAPGVGLKTTASGVFAKRQKVEIAEGTQRVVDPCEPLAPHLIEEPIHIPHSRVKQ